MVIVKLQKIELIECTLDKDDIIDLASMYNIRELNIKLPREKLVRQDYTDAFQAGNLSSLEVLNLKGRVNLNGDGLKALLKGSPMLRHVELELIEMVTDFADVIDECSLEHLETLHVVYYGTFQDHDIDALKRKCPKMRSIRIDHVIPFTMSLDSFPFTMSLDSSDFDDSSDS